MKTITVKAHNQVGTIAEHSVVTQDGVPTVIQATNKINYELFDEAAGQAPRNIVTQRVNKDLHVSFEAEGVNPDLIIEGFYNVDNALMGVAADGSYYYYVPHTGEVADVVTELQPGDIEGQTLGGEPQGTPWWVSATDGFDAVPWLLGLAGAGVAGAALSGGSDGNEDDSNDDTDTTAPTAPSVVINEEGTVISGNAEPGSSVEIDVNGDGDPDYTVEADAETGDFTVDTSDTPLVDGETITATATDDAGNESEPTTITATDTTAPTAPSVVINEEGTMISGTAEAGSRVEIDVNGDGDPDYTVEADAETGDFTVDTSDTPLVDGETITATATDDAGNESEPTTITATDTTAPTAPSVTIGDGDDTVDGFDLNANGDVTVSVTLPEDAKIGDTVTVNGTETMITQAMLDDGYDATVMAPEEGETLAVTVTVTDQAGNSSEPGEATATVGDITAPTAPSIVINEEGTVISGTAEPSSSVEIDVNGDGDPDYTVEADAETGDFTVDTSDTPLVDGETITATATDDSGNESEPTTITAIDTTAPEAPLAAPVITDNVDGNGAPLDPAETISDGGITNDNTPGVTVPADQVANGTPQLVVNGDVVASTPVTNADGSVILTPVDALENDSYEISYNLIDEAGNVSEASPATTITVDTVAPGGEVDAAIAAPVVVIDDEADDGVNAAEFADGVQTQVTLPSGTVAGDTVTLTVTPDGGDPITVDYVVTADDLDANLGNGIADVTIPNDADDGITADGEYSVTATVTDAAGNVSESSAAVSFTVDTTAPEAPLAAPAITDNVDSDGSELTPVETVTDGGLTNDNTPGVVVPAEQVANGTPQLVVDGNVVPSTSTPNDDGSVTLTPTTPLTDGDHTLSYNLIDEAGNMSEDSPVTNVTVDATAPAAQDDSNDIDLGKLQVTTYPSVNNDSVTVLGVAESDSGADGTLDFTVSEGANGTVSIEVSQTALVAVADAVNIEVYNSNGDRVYVGTTGGDPLVGDVIGLELLGLTGNDTLTAVVSGLEPDNYTVVVRKSESALATLVEDVELAELGDSGIILGPNNQDAVLNAVEASLNTDYPVLHLGTTVKGILTVALGVTNELGVDALVTLLQDNTVLNGLLGGVVDPVLDAVAEALLSNTLTLLETTDVTATLTEYDFGASIAITGNVIDPDGSVTGELGEDTVTINTKLTDISSDNTASEPTSQLVDGVNVFTIEGQYGVLLIDENGDYTYTTNGDYASSGETDVFEYTISNGAAGNSDTAQLVINISSTAPSTPTTVATVTDNVANDGSGDVLNPAEIIADNGFTNDNTPSLVIDANIVDDGDTPQLVIDDIVVDAIVVKNADGSYALTPQTPLDDGEYELSYNIKDAINNVSGNAPSVTITVDTIAPAAPVVEVNTDGTEVSGTAEPNSLIEIDIDGDGVPDYSGTTNGAGDYVIDTSANPLVNGETVTATATDAAGNESDPSTVEVPVKLVANDDPAVAGLDVTPTSSTTTSDDDSSLKNEETSVLNLLGIGSFEVSVDFTVAANNIGSAEVNFSSTGIANVLDNGSLVLQKKDGNGIYVNVDSAASATGLLNVLDLLGDGVPDGYTLSGLTAGDYRLVGSVNPAVGLITTGTLEVVTLTETSITGIDDIQAVNATGNVIDENDVSTDDTVVTTVTVNGTDTPINASGDTSITGTYGELLISADGDYTYTPTENASGIGKEDVFNYTIVDTVTGSTDSATLMVSIESDYPAVDFPVDAVDDVATAELIVNPETTTQDPIYGYDDVLLLGTASVTELFTIATGNIGSAVFRIDSTELLGDGASVVVEKQTGSDSWESIATQADGRVTGLLGIGDRLLIAVEDLSEGSYRITTTATGVGASVTLDGTITEVTPDMPASSDPIVTGGNVISENDDVTLSTVVTEVNGVTVSATESTDIVGSYGTLTMNADGSYFYTPNSNINVINQVESFEYTILDDYGNTDTATLTINITSDWPAPEPVAARSMMIEESFTLADETDDTIELPDTSLITSSEGINTLSFEGSGQIISLSDMMQPDIIDISGIGANTLNIAAEDVDATIYIKGDNDDTVNLEGDSWASVGQTTSEGEVYDVWQSGSDISNQVHIDTEITNII